MSKLNHLRLKYAIAMVGWMVLVLCNCTRPSCPIKCGHARTGQVGGGNRTLAKQVTVPDERMVAACGFRWKIFHQFTCTNESWTRVFIEHFPRSRYTGHFVPPESRERRARGWCRMSFGKIFVPTDYHLANAALG